MTDESVHWTKKVQQTARNFNLLNKNPGAEAKSGNIRPNFEVFQQTARAEKVFLDFQSFELKC